MEKSESVGENSSQNLEAEQTDVEADERHPVEVTRIEVEFLPAAAKDLKAIGKGKPLAQITAKLDELEKNPLPHDAKAIRGEHFKANGWNFYRVDVGEYRIVYDLDERTGLLTIVTIAVIAARNDDKVYKLMQRRFG